MDGDFYIGDRLVRPALNRIIGDGRDVRVEPRAMQVLRYLADRPGEVVARDDLIRAVWRETFVTDDALKRCVSDLRKALGDHRKNSRFIETIPKGGYRLIALVSVGTPLDSAGLPDPRVPRTHAARSARARAPLVAMCILGVVVAAAVWLWPRLLPAAASRLEVALPSGVKADPPEALPGVSPDGALVAFIASRDGGPSMIWVRRLDSDAAAPIPGSEGALSAFWSPDGKHLGYFANKKLRAISIDGGPPRDICDVADSRGGSWSDSGVIVFASGARSALSKVPALGGVPEPATVLDGDRRDVSHRWPNFLPDGRRFLFVVWSGETSQQGIYLGSLDGAEPKRLLEDVSPASWAAGHLFFVRRETLVAQPWDLSSLRPRGEPFAIATSVSRSPNDESGFAVSPAGHVAYTRTRFESRLVWFDRSGRELEELGPPAHYGEPAISRDGHTVAFGYRDRAQGQENLDVWLLDLVTRARTRVTHHESIDVVPVWSPDGNEILFRSNRSGFSDLYRRRLDLSRPDELVFASKLRKDPTDWSPDGRSIVYNLLLSELDSDIYLLPLTGDSEPSVLVTGHAWQANGRFSPDGRYIAYESNEHGSRDIFVDSLRGEPRRWRVSTAGGMEPAWRADGTELYFLSAEGIEAVAVTSSPQGLAFGEPRRLFRVAPPPFTLRNRFAASKDGERFLVNIAVPQLSSPVTVIRNWARKS